MEAWYLREPAWQPTLNETCCHVGFPWNLVSFKKLCTLDFWISQPLFWLKRLKMLGTQSRSKSVLWLRDALISSSCTQSLPHLLVTSLPRLFQRPRAGRLQRGFASCADGEQHETAGTVQAHGQPLLFYFFHFFWCAGKLLERKSGMTTVPDMINTIVSWRLDH